jgi:hypothetical protein
MDKISTHFRIQDFVPKALFLQFGANAIWFIDPFQVNYAELLWSRYNKQVIINTWASGGVLENRGTRMPDCATGGKLSQHKFKKAIDTNVLGVPPEAVAKDIIDNFSIYQKVGLTAIEDVKFTTGEVEGDLKGWNHGDGRWTNQNGILIVKP